MWNLVADVGGTNMRLAAMGPDGTLSDQRAFASKGGLDFPQACAAFIEERSGAPSAVVVAAAGVVADGAVQLTNSRQRFSESDLASVCGCDTVKILNDFEAAAWSLATVSAADVTTLQGPAEPPSGPRVIIGPGTGLGVGALVWACGQPYVIPGEGGHVSLGPRSADEVPYFQSLVRIWPDVQIGEGCAVEAEAVLSGTGLPFFYRAVADATGGSHTDLSAEEVLGAGRDGTDKAAVIVTQLFQRSLGSVAGDLGLVFGASGGVFLTGGVALSNQWLFDQTFLAAFNSGGRHSKWRQNLPVYLYQNADFGLLGARNYLSTTEG